MPPIYPYQLKKKTPHYKHHQEIKKIHKVKEKVILVGGVNGKRLSTDKFTTSVHNIPGATSDDTVHHNSIPEKP